jgi:hypothetical protein
MKADIQLLMSRMSELEIVDSFNSIERHLHGEILVNCSVSSKIFISNNRTSKTSMPLAFFNLLQLCNNCYACKHLSEGGVFWI